MATTKQGSSGSHGEKSSGSRSAQSNPGNFKNNPERASEAGKKGGEHSHGGTHEQHVKAGQQSHKNK